MSLTHTDMDNNANNADAVVMDTAVDMTAMVRDDPAVSELYGQLRSTGTRMSRCRVFARRGAWIAAAVVVIVICMVVVFTVVEPGKTENKQQQQEPPSSNDLLGRKRFILFRTLLARVSEPAVFVSPNSPQSEALQWLVYQDETLPIPPSVTLSTSMANMDNTTTDGDGAPEELKEFQRRLTQRYALMVLAFSTSGENWRGIVPWMDHKSTHECHQDFQAVECDQETGAVIDLYLLDRQLTGRVPEEIGLLSELKYLDLSRNPLWGRIPHSLYHGLTNLEAFAIHFTDMAFSLHEDIGRLSNLEIFHVSNTYLAGTLPASMIKLTKLRELVIFNTELSSDSFFELAEHWVDLEVLVLEQANLTGTVPPEIGLLSNLEDLSLRESGIGGQLPTEIGLLTNLKRIVLGGEEFQGSLPSEIGMWTNVETIVLTPAPEMSGTLPSTLGSMSSLNYLAIVSTSIQGSIPTEIGMLSNLRSLNVEANLLTGTVPNQVVAIPSLTNLQINFNDMTGTISQALCDKPSLVVWLDCSKMVCENNCCPSGWCTGT